MIYVNMMGRLGNQLFIYSFLRSVIMATKDESVMINWGPCQKQGFGDELKHYKVIAYESTVSSSVLSFALRMKGARKFVAAIIVVIDKLISIFSYDLRSKWSGYLNWLGNRFGVYIAWQGYVDLSINSDDKKDKFVFGNFESIKYFSHLHENILTEITPVAQGISKNSSLYEMIDASESVCLSIRRGDFLTPEFSKVHSVCSLDYYKQAICEIRQRLPDANFFVFSDDIQWCKDVFSNERNFSFEDGDDPVWEKLRMMSSCKHFILSNSTFSWWAQCLSRNKSKIVVCPKRWKNSGVTSDLIDPNWLLLDV